MRVGSFSQEDHHAALAHDLMLLRCGAPSAIPKNLIFAFKTYREILPQLDDVTQDELLLILRRQGSTSFKQRGL